MQQTTNKTQVTFVPLLTPEEACTFLKIKGHVLYEHHTKGTGPKYIYITGKTKRYRMTDLETWIDARTCQNTSQEYLIKEKIKQQLKGKGRDDEKTA